MSNKPKTKSPKAKPPGKAAIRSRMIQVGPHKLEMNARVSMLLDQEAILFDAEQNPSIVGAREGQNFGEMHHTAISVFCLVAKSAEEQGLELTPYDMFDLVPFEEMASLVEEMNLLLGQLPGADSGNGRQKSH